MPLLAPVNSLRTRGEAMSDEEVGKIWAKHKLPIVRQLIRKLVEERASNWDDLGAALESYGIDPATWEKP